MELAFEEEEDIFDKKIEIVEIQKLNQILRYRKLKVNIFRRSRYSCWAVSSSVALAWGCCSTTKTPLIIPNAGANVLTRENVQNS